MHTLICVTTAPTGGILDIELAEFLLAYNAYQAPASIVFINQGLDFLNPNIPSKVPGPTPHHMLSALCYGDNQVYGIKKQDIDFTPCVSLLWIDESMLTELKATHPHCLIY